MSLRARVELSQLIRKIEFTETIKRRLIDHLKEAVEGVMRLKREVDHIERQLNRRTRRSGSRKKRRRTSPGGRRTSSSR